MINAITTQAEYVELPIDKMALGYMIGRISVDIIADACRNRHTNKVLVQSLQVVTNDDMKDTLRLCSYLVDKLAGVKIALLYEENRSGDLLAAVETIVQRQEVDLKFFQDQSAALAWLGSFGQ